jgi:hypothetical protein
MEIDPRFLMLVAIVFAVWMVLLGTRRMGGGLRKVCRECGAAHPAFAKFCRRCGKRL